MESTALMSSCMCFVCTLNLQVQNVNRFATNSFSRAMNRARRRDELSLLDEVAETVLEIFQTALAGSEASAGLKHNNRFPLGQRAKLFDAIEVHQTRAVYANKAFGRQPLFHLGHRRTHEISFWSHVNTYVIAFGFHPINFARLKRNDAFPLFD